MIKKDFLHLPKADDLNFSEKEYKTYLNFARKITSNIEPYELLHQTIEKLLNKQEIHKGKDAYVYVCLRNSFLDQKRKTKNKIDFQELELSTEPNHLPELNHIFKVIKELEVEGKKRDANRFLQANFALSVKEVARREMVTESAIRKSCIFVKNEIRKRYDFTIHD